MAFGKRCVRVLIVACLAATVWAAAAAFAGDEDCVAVAYTLPGFQGVSWKIAAPGRYDLFWKIDDAAGADVPEPFGLPNDSICSIRICPGRRVTIFEHATFGGESRVLEGDVPDLGLWKRCTSSLVVGWSDEDAVKEWLGKVGAEKHRFAEPAGKMDRKKIADLLDGYEEEFTVLRDNGEPKWYGETRDEGRIDAGAFLVKFFGELGYDMSMWTPNSFAQQINNFYDWRKDLSIWRTACLVVDVDAEMYEDIFAERGR